MNELLLNNLYFESEMQTLYDLTTLDINYLSNFNESSNDNENGIKKIYSKIKDYFQDILDKFQKSEHNNVKIRGNKVFIKYKDKTISVDDIIKNFVNLEQDFISFKGESKRTIRVVEFYEYFKILEKYSKISDKNLKEWLKLKDKGKTTPEKAKKFIKKYKKFEVQCKNEFYSISSKKKVIPINKAIKMAKDCLKLLKSSVFDMWKQIRLYREMCDRVICDLEWYEDQRGYIIHANTIKKMVHNKVIFFQQNISSIGFHMISACLSMINFLAKKLPIWNEEDKFQLGASADELSSEMHLRYDRLLRGKNNIYGHEWGDQDPMRVYQNSKKQKINN